MSDKDNREQPTENFSHPEIPLALTYDDVLLIPQHSAIPSRSLVTTESHLVGNISLHVPLISSPMDTISSAEMNIALARNGALGFAHRFQTIEGEVTEVSKTKRFRSYIIKDPHQCLKKITVKEADKIMREHEVGGLMVVDEEDRLIGIVTERDIWAQAEDTLVEEVMTPREQMITAPEGIGVDEAERLLRDGRVEKLPLLDDDGRVHGLIVTKDLKKAEQYPHSTIDDAGRLAVGAAVGVVGDYLERSEALVSVGADMLVVDVAHAHTDHTARAMKELKKLLPDTPLVGGTVATGEGVRFLAEAGADIVRVGVGSGSICSTRLVSGSGVPQVTALQDSIRVAEECGVTILADGGISGSNDFAKAIATGASAIVVGSLLAGTPETPGRIVNRQGRRLKIYRGMASQEAFENKLEAEGVENAEVLSDSYTPEGVETSIPLKPSVESIIAEMKGGLRSAMTYSGAMTIPEFQEKARFVRITHAGQVESDTHIYKQGGS